MVKHGGTFSPHKYRVIETETKVFRICKKCGQCEIERLGIDSISEIVSFDEWQTTLKAYQESTEKQERKKQESKNNALKWIELNQ